MIGGATVQFVRSELRLRAVSYVVLAVVVALGSGVCIGALVLAHRTDRAYPDFVQDAQVNPLVINPSLASDAMDAAIRQFSGVRSVHTDDLLLGTVRQTEGGILAELMADEVDANVQVLGSPDGRFVEVDRPIVTEGRLPTGERELFVTEGYRDGFAASLGRSVAVGDTVDMAFYEAALSMSEADPSQHVVPLGVEPLRIVGFGRLGDEILPDDVYPRERMIVSADVAARYQCSFPFRPDIAEAEFYAEFFRGCSTQYRYYSLELEPGTSLTGIRDQFEAASARLTPELPAFFAESGFGYYYISQDRSDVDDAVRQTTRPPVTALVAFAAVAALATVVIFGLTASRLLRRNDQAQLSLLALGATTSTRAIAVGGALLGAMALGLAGAVVIAGLLSLIGPLGSVSVLAPSADWSLPASVVVPALLALGAVLLVLVAAGAYGAARRVARPAEGRSRSARRRALRPRGSRPAMWIGVRAALGDRRSGANTAVLAGCVVAVAVVAAATVFGSNLAAVVDSPARYGWPWQVGVLTGGGYGDTDVAAVESTLAGHDEVRDVSYYTFDPATLIDGEPVPVVFGFPGSEASEFAVVEGRPARRPGEIVLGTRTAAELGLEIGDEVAIESIQASPGEVTVVGTAVMPAIGSFVADRSGLGRGAYVPIDADPAIDDAAAFIAIRLRDGVDPADFVASLGADIYSWDAFTLPVVLSHPARPPEIVNIGDMRGAPLILAGVLAAALAIGLAMSISVSVRDRWRDLAILRALGLGGRDLGATVRWQAVATIVVGLAAGLPLGVVAGRYAWRRFADELGLVPRADVPGAWLALVGIGALVLALVAAQRPGRAASALSPAEVLRSQ